MRNAAPFHYDDRSMQCMMAVVSPAVYLSLVIGILISTSSGVLVGVPTYPINRQELSIVDEEGTCTGLNQEICSGGTNLTCTACTASRFQSSNTIDGNIVTRWASTPAFINPSLTIGLGQEYNVSSIDIVFGRQPPLSWVLDYSFGNSSSFSPGIAVVSLNEDCNNYTSYPYCATNMHQIDLLPLQFQKISFLKLTFIQTSMGQDQREMFVDVREISLSAVCESAYCLFNDSCTDTTSRIYKPVIPVSSVGKRFIWSHVRETVPPPLGSWFMDDVMASANGSGSDFFESFEQSPLNSSIWMVSGGETVSVSGQQVLLVSSSPREVSLALPTTPTPYQSIRFHLGFFDPNIQCMSDLGEVELSQCHRDTDECTLIGLYVLNDCGDCVNQHLLSLRHLMSDLHATLRGLPPYSVLIVSNITDLMIISQDEDNYDSLYFEWLLGLTAVERVHGFPSEYPRNITLPTHIAIIEVTSPNLELFDRYCTLVDNISRYDYIGNETQEVVMMSMSLADVAVQLGNETALVEDDIEVLIQDMSNLLQELISHFNNISSAVINGDMALNLIRSRNYDNLITEIALLLNASEDATIEGAQFTLISESHFEILQNITGLLATSRDQLNAVLNSSVTAIEIADNISLILEDVYNVLEDIKDLILEGNELKALIEASLLSTQQQSNATRDILITGNELLLITNDTMESINGLVSQLASRVEHYNNTLRDRYLPLGYPAPCQLEPVQLGPITCLSGELHSKHLELNSSRIISGSESTRSYAREFLDGLMDPPMIDFNDINVTATNAIIIGEDIIRSVQNTGLAMLAMDVDETQTYMNQLSTNVSMLAEDAEMSSLRAHEQYNRSITLQHDLLQTQDTISRVQDEIRELEMTQNYTAVSIDIIQRMMVADESLDGVNSTITALEGDTVVIGGTLDQLVDTIQDTRDMLDYAEEEVLRSQDFLSRASSALNQTTSSLRNTIQLNNDIISDIDMLLQSVDSAHELLHKINSPGKFQTNGTIQPYLSLQPPPAHDSVQDMLLFDSLKIYMNAEGEYRAPGLIYYMGPIVEEGAPGNDTALLTEDYLAIVDKTSPRRVSVEWRMGGVTGTQTISYTVSDQTQLFLKRVGSMFELSGGAVDPLPTPGRSYNLVEGSLIFKTTPNTVFLFGGRPSGAELALPDYSSYNSLIGTLDLIIYNGDLWSPWNYRRHSQTSFIGSFIRHEAATEENTLGTNRLSFDGEGYLKPKIFSNHLSITSPPAYFITLTYKVDSLEGLLMYLYDPVESISMEAAIVDGRACVRLDDSINPVISHCYSLPTVYTNEQQILMRFGRNLASIVLGSPSPPFNTFPDLSRVEAWFGGVVLDQLPQSYRPVLTTKGIRGCIDVTLFQSGLNARVFRQSTFFIQNYLNSPVQKGFSGNCFTSRYAYVLSLNGTEYPSYSALDVTRNQPAITIDDYPVTDQVSLSISYLPHQDNVMLFAAVENNNMIIAELINQILQLSIVNGNSGVTTRLSDVQSASLMEWHHLIVEIRSPTHSEGESIRLFHDNTLVDTVSLTGFTFSLPYDTNDPSAAILYMGGAPDSVPKTTSTFVGCLKNFAYNLDAMKFLNQYLLSFDANDDISFHKCLFSLPLISSELPVVSSEPQTRLCSSNEPVTTNDTIGGFHALSQVLSYNVLPFQSMSWRFHLSLRFYSHDGHVITFPSRDVSLSLFIDNGNLKWSLTGHDGSQTISTGTPFTSHMWHDLTVHCNTSLALIHCTSYSNGVIIDGVSHSVGGLSGNPNLFYPAIPIVIGRTSEERGFVGCIRALLVNDSPLGFDSEGLSTCEQCYADPIDGWGFKGLGFLMKRIESAVTPAHYHVSFSFKPFVDHGLLLYIRSPSNNAPLLAVGLYNGEVRVTNFTIPGSFISLSNQSVCASQSFHNFSIELSQSVIVITLTNPSDSSQSHMSMQSVAMVTSPLDIYIGGVQEDDEQDIGLFQFLLSDEGVALSSPVPGFIGCMRAIEVTSGSGSPNYISMVTDADQYKGITDGLCPN